MAGFKDQQEAIDFYDSVAAGGLSELDKLWRMRKPAPVDAGFFGGLSSGFKSTLGQGLVGIGDMLGSEGVDEYGRSFLKAAEEEMPGGADSTWEILGSGIGSTIPAIGGALAGGAAAVATLPATATAATIAGVGGLGSLLGASLTGYPTHAGGNILAQEQTGAPVNRSLAYLTAVPQTVLDSIFEVIMAGKFIKLGGKLVAATAPEAKKILQPKLFKTVAKDAATGAATEVPTELGQQILQRAQAGQEIFSDEAMAEYADIAYASGLVGGVLGGAGGVAQYSSDKKDYNAYQTVTERVNQLNKQAEELAREMEKRRQQTIAADMQKKYDPTGKPLQLTYQPEPQAEKDRGNFTAEEINKAKGNVFYTAEDLGDVGDEINKNLEAQGLEPKKVFTLSDINNLPNEYLGRALSNIMAKMPGSNVVYDGKNDRLTDAQKKAAANYILNNPNGIIDFKKMAAAIGLGKTNENPAAGDLVNVKLDNEGTFTFNKPVKYIGTKRVVKETKVPVEEPKTSNTKQSKKTEKKQAQQRKVSRAEVEKALADAGVTPAGVKEVMASWEKPEHQKLIADAMAGKANLSGGIRTVTKEDVKAALDDMKAVKKEFDRKYGILMREERGSAKRQKYGRADRGEKGYTKEQALAEMRREHEMAGKRYAALKAQLARAQRAANSATGTSAKVETKATPKKFKIQKEEKLVAVLKNEETGRTYYADPNDIVVDTHSPNKVPTYSKADFNNLMSWLKSVGVAEYKGKGQWAAVNHRALISEFDSMQSKGFSIVKNSDGKWEFQDNRVSSTTKEEAPATRNTFTVNQLYSGGKDDEFVFEVGGKNADGKQNYIASKGKHVIIKGKDAAVEYARKMTGKFNGQSVKIKKAILDDKGEFQGVEPPKYVVLRQNFNSAGRMVSEVPVSIHDNEDAANEARHQAENDYRNSPQRFSDKDVIEDGARFKRNSELSPNEVKMGGYYAGMFKALGDSLSGLSKVAAQNADKQFHAERSGITDEELIKKYGKLFQEVLDEINNVYRGVGLDKLGITFNKQMVVQGPNGVVLGTYSSLNKLISLSVAPNWNVNETNVETIKKHLVSVMYHEAFHALRDLGVITEAEWNMLKKDVSERKAPGESKTYHEMVKSIPHYRKKLDPANMIQHDYWINMAVNNLTNRGLKVDYKSIASEINAISEDKMYEEAMAFYMQDWAAGKLVPLKAKNLFQKIFDFIRSIFKKTNNFGESEKLFKDISTGVFAQRTPIINKMDGAVMTDETMDAIDIDSNRRLYIHSMVPDVVRYDIGRGSNKEPIEFKTYHMVVDIAKRDPGGLFPYARDSVFTIDLIPTDSITGYDIKGIEYEKRFRDGKVEKGVIDTPGMIMNVGYAGKSLSALTKITDADWKAFDSALVRLRKFFTDTFMVSVLGGQRVTGSHSAAQSFRLTDPRVVRASGLSSWNFILKASELEIKNIRDNMDKFGDFVGKTLPGMVEKTPSNYMGDTGAAGPLTEQEVIEAFNRSNRKRDDFLLDARNNRVTPVQRENQRRTAAERSQALDNAAQLEMEKEDISFRDPDYRRIVRQDRQRVNNAQQLITAKAMENRRLEEIERDIRRNANELSRAKNRISMAMDPQYVDRIDAIERARHERELAEVRRLQEEQDRLGRERAQVFENARSLQFEKANQTYNVDPRVGEYLFEVENLRGNSPRISFAEWVAQDPANRSTIEAFNEYSARTENEMLLARRKRQQTSQMQRSFNRFGAYDVTDSQENQIDLNRDDLRRYKEEVTDRADPRILMYRAYNREAPTLRNPRMTFEEWVNDDPQNRSTPEAYREYLYRQDNETALFLAKEDISIRDPDYQRTVYGGDDWVNGPPVGYDSDMDAYFAGDMDSISSIDGVKSYAASLGNRVKSMSSNPQYVKTIDSDRAYGKLLYALQDAAKRFTPGWVRQWFKLTDEIIDDVVRRIYVQMADKDIPIGELIDRARRANGGIIKPEWDVFLQAELANDQAMPEIENVKNKYLFPLLDFIKTNGISLGDLNNFLYARHASERNALVRLRNAGRLFKMEEDLLKKGFTPEQIDEIIPRDMNAGSGMSDQEATNILNRVNNHHLREQFYKAADMAYDIIKETNNIRRASGLQKAAEELISEDFPGFKFYVPLRGFAEEETWADDQKDNPMARNGGKYLIHGLEDRHITGRESKAGNILEHIVLQNFDSVFRSKRNQVGNALYNLLKDGNNPSLERFVRIINVPTKKILTSSGKIQYAVDHRFRENERYFVTKVDGKEVVFEFETGPGNILTRDGLALSKAMRGATKYQDVSTLTKALQNFNMYMTKINTAWSPEFMFVNAIRDWGLANFNMSQYDIKDLQSQTFKNMKTSYWVASKKDSKKVVDYGFMTTKPQEDWTMEETYDALLKLGGTSQYYPKIDLNSIGKEINEALSGATNKTLASKSWDAVGKVFQTVEHYNTAVEHGIRLAFFKSLLEKGIDMQKAAQAAKGLTVNFSKGGEQKVLLNALYLFYNASIQGTMGMFIAAARNPKLYKYFAYIMGAGFMMDVMNRAMSGEDDDGNKYYDNLPMWKKENHLSIPITPDGKYLSIPLPWGLSFFWNTGRAMASAGGGGDPQKEAMSAVSGFFNNFSPIGSMENFANWMAPTIVDPIISISSNKKWDGSPIQPTNFPGQAQQPNSQLYWNSTSATLKETSRLLNEITLGNENIPGFADFSPNMLEYVINFATGSAGMFALRGADFFGDVLPRMLTGGDFETSEVPFLRRLTLTGSSDKANQQKYQESYIDIINAASAMKDAKDDKDRERVKYYGERFKAELEVADRVKKIQAERTKIRKEIREISDNSRLSSAYKDSMIKRLKERDSELVRRSNAIYAKAKEAS